MKKCPECGSHTVGIFDSDNDHCTTCGKWFPAVAELPDVCEWTMEEGADWWQTSCGSEWTTSDGTPADNGMNYCPMCGRKLMQVSCPSLELEAIKMKEFIDRRDSALLSLNKEDLVALFNETAAGLPGSETIFWAAVHKARLQVTSFPDEVKAESRDWLHANGFAV